MRPVIGIPLRYQKLKDDRPIVYMSERLRRTIQIAGGLVYAISPLQNVDYINTRGNEFLELTEEEKEIIEMEVMTCDGILFPGGIKFTPYDRYLLEVAVRLNIPVLGICLGMQMMSCLGKDIDLIDVDTGVCHMQENDEELSHYVNIIKDSKLYEILGKERLLVNSFHKRRIKSSGIYREVGYSDDGLIEAIEYSKDNFNIGIQWHPEISYEFDDNSKKIIDAFIEAAREKKKIKEKN